MKRMSTRTMTQFALFVAMIFLLGLTPLGYITLPLAAFTIVHVPVIIGAYHFGTKGSMLLGFFFGVTSLITCFTRPDAIAAIVLGTSTGFGLYNLFLIVVILLVPRVLVGLFASLTHKALKKENSVVAMGLAAFAGSMTNTVFVLGGLYVFAFRQAGLAFGLAFGFTAGEFLNVLFSVALVNGIAEAAIAVVICTVIGKALAHLEERRTAGPAMPFEEFSGGAPIKKAKGGQLAEQKEENGVGAPEAPQTAPTQEDDQP